MDINIILVYCFYVWRTLQCVPSLRRLFATFKVKLASLITVVDAYGPEMNKSGTR